MPFRIIHGELKLSLESRAFEFSHYFTSAIRKLFLTTEPDFHKHSATTYIDTHSFARKKYIYLINRSHLAAILRNDLAGK